MASKGDVKAVRVTATGAVFAGRTRLRGIILASDGGAFANGEDFRIDGGLVITPRTRPGAGSHSKE